MELKLVHEDEKLLTRKIEVKINNKKIETPIKAFELISSKKTSPFNLLGNFAKEANGLVEFRLNISQKQLIKIDGDERKANRFISVVHQQLEHIGKNNVILLVPTYKIESPNISTVEIEYLSSLLLSFLRNGIIDVFSTPIVKQDLKIVTPDFYFNSFVKPLLEYIFSYNKEGIAKYFFGYIPKVSHRQIDEIVKFYLKYYITNFVVEFNSSTPINYGPVLERLIRSVLLMEKEIGREGTLIHGINVNRGLGRKGIDKIGAKDVLAFYQGITSFSFPFKIAIKQLEEPTFRIFEPTDYGYYKSSRDELRMLSEKEKIIKVENMKDIEKAINSKRIYVEASVIREKLMENELPKYLNSKRGIQTYLKKLQNFSNKIKEKSASTSLNKFL
jgi:hypothetical protein